MARSMARISSSGTLSTPLGAGGDVGVLQLRGDHAKGGDAGGVVREHRRLQLLGEYRAAPWPSPANFLPYHVALRVVPAGSTSCVCGTVEVGEPYDARMTSSVDEIIERLGGAEAVARRLGVGTEAVWKWRQSHSIPARHRPALLAATGLALHELPGAPPADGEVAALASPARRRRWCWGMAACCGGAGSARIPATRRRPRSVSIPLTGHQETLTDPSYAGQIICSAFPAIGTSG